MNYGASESQERQEIGESRNVYSTTSDNLTELIYRKGNLKFESKDVIFKPPFLCLGAGKLGDIVDFPGVPRESDSRVFIDCLSLLFMHCL